MNLDNIIKHVEQKYNCHTIILYGSFAKGNFDEESDIDMLCFTCEKSRNIKSIYNSKLLDIKIYNDKEIKCYKQFANIIKTAKILLDKKEIAEAFLSKVKKEYNKGPLCQDIETKKSSILWLEQMLSRSEKNNLEGIYRLHWLLTDILPIYFELIDKWYLGSKESFSWLQENDNEAYQLYKNLYLNPNSNNIKDVIQLLKKKYQTKEE